MLVERLWIFWRQITVAAHLFRMLTYLKSYVVKVTMQIELFIKYMVPSLNCSNIKLKDVSWTNNRSNRLGELYDITQNNEVFMILLQELNMRV